jgi:hypothetical protein
VKKKKEKQENPYTDEEIQAHKSWRAHYKIEPCTKMHYLMCPDAIEVLKKADKIDTVYVSEEQVNRDLIDEMNIVFGDDVFIFKCRPGKKYMKIGCKRPGCPFDIWLKYTIGP